MRQRGRKTAEARQLTSVNGAPSRLTPPPGLSKAERKLFSELIEACSPLHFVPSDLPLIVSYCQATVMARRVVRGPRYAATWERFVRVQGMLATRLRLAPQARSDPKTILRQIPNRGPVPWEWNPATGQRGSRDDAQSR